MDMLVKEPMTNDNSSPETRPNKGRNTANNALIKKLSYSNVSPKEQMLLHAFWELRKNSQIVLQHFDDEDK